MPQVINSKPIITSSYGLGKLESIYFLIYLNITKASAVILRDDGRSQSFLILEKVKHGSGALVLLVIVK